MTEKIKITQRDLLEKFCSWIDDVAPRYIDNLESYYEDELESSDLEGEDFWIDKLMAIPQENWVCGCFKFDTTKEGYNYWFSVKELWLNELEKYEVEEEKKEEPDEKRELCEEKDKELIESWAVMAKEICSVEELVAFIPKLKGYNHSYGSIVHAASAVMYAARRTFSRGISAQQAAYVAEHIGHMVAREYGAPTEEGKEENQND